MPREFPRSRRIEEQIHRILSHVLRSGARDPQLHQAIVTEVRVSRDLSVARVFVSSLDPQADHLQLLQAFQRAGGFLRSEVAAGLSVRQVPELRFQFDDSLDRAAHMDALLEAARSPGTLDQADDGDGQ